MTTPVRKPDDMAWTAPDPGQTDYWADALAAAELFAIDPVGLKGIAVADGPGPVRDLWYAHLERALAPGLPVKRLPAGIEDDRLIGAIDLPATLAAGRPIARNGVLAEADGGLVVIPMAERVTAGTAARIAAAIDQQEVAIEREGLAGRTPSRIGIVAFDESSAPDERMPAALSERCAFLIRLRGLRFRTLSCPATAPSSLAEARARLKDLAPPTDEMIQALVATSASLGIVSVTAPLLALRAAAAAAALAGRSFVAAEDAVLAARLVLAPRALAVPAEAPDDDAEPPPEPDRDRDDATPPDDPPAEPPSLDQLADILLAAAKAALPDGLLERIDTGMASRRRSGDAAGTGSVQNTSTRGRPSGTRMGQPKSGARLALVETLRAAAPWQALRRADAREPRGVEECRRILIRREDLRVKRFVRRRETTIVFCVDASGSAAFHRLAETKGAVELVLGQAYITRTSVALVVFRGQKAELLLPPTRSLSRAKALLAKLPGGGGTPLAAGIEMAALTALAERLKGRQPLIMLMTDGRANIARDGTARRPGAMDDAMEAARRLAWNRLDAVFIDTAPRPREEGRRLAQAMDARCVALPYVEAETVRDVAMAAVSEQGPRPVYGR